MAETEFRYRLDRRPRWDNGVLYPRGSFIISDTELTGDNYVAVDANGYDLPRAAPAAVPVTPQPSIRSAHAAAPPLVAPRETLDPLSGTMVVGEPVAAVVAGAAGGKPDGNNDGQRDTLQSLTKAQLGERLTGAGLTPAMAGFESWSESGKSPKKDDLIALVLGETTVADIKAAKAA